MLDNEVSLRNDLGISKCDASRSIDRVASATATKREVFGSSDVSPVER